MPAQKRAITPTDMHWLPRAVFLVYFVTHIPITLMFDLQALLPVEWYPTVLREMVQSYAVGFGDPFMALRQPFPWFTSFIVCEVCGIDLAHFKISPSWIPQLLFQLPIFFLAVWGLWNSGFSSLK